MAYLLEMTGFDVVEQYPDFHGAPPAYGSESRSGSPASAEQRRCSGFLLGRVSIGPPARPSVCQPDNSVPNPRLE